MRSLPTFLTTLTIFAAASGAGLEAQRVLYTHESIAFDRNYAESVGGAGDVDGDGRDDIIVGAPGTLADRGYAGRAIVLSGRDGMVLHTFAGTTPSERFGQSVDGVGDVDRDGRPDLVVGIADANGNGTETGRVHVYSGRTGLLLWAVDGESAWDRFGWAVAGAGDVDADGHADVVVGAPMRLDGLGRQTGAIYILSGRDGSRLYRHYGAAPNARYGWSVDGVGDVDGDGRADVGVGAPDDSAIIAGGGRAFVYSGRNGQRLHEVRTAVGGARLGHSIAAAGDADGDGNLDFMVGAPGGQAVHVISGHDGATLQTIYGGGISRFGHSVANAGDVDGDGRPDVAIGAPQDHRVAIRAGSVSVWSSADGTELYRVAGRARDEHFGWCVAAAGRIDRDARQDIVAGSLGTMRIAEFGYARVLSGARLSLTTDTHVIEWTEGGRQTMSLDATATEAGTTYAIVGSLSGTSVGMPFQRVHLWINFDFYTTITSALVANAFGQLDASGRATAAIDVGRFINGARGLRFDHAYVTFDPANPVFRHASNPIPLTIR